MCTKTSKFVTGNALPACRPTIDLHGARASTEQQGIYVCLFVCAWRIIKNMAGQGFEKKKGGGGRSLGKNWAGRRRREKKEILFYRVCQRVFAKEKIYRIFSSRIEQIAQLYNFKKLEKEKEERKISRRTRRRNVAKRVKFIFTLKT